MSNFKVGKNLWTIRKKSYRMPPNMFLVRKRGRVKTGLKTKMRRFRVSLKIRNSVEIGNLSEKKSESLSTNSFSKKRTNQRGMQGRKTREFYATINTVNGLKPKNLHPVRTKSGELLSSPDDIKER